MGGVFSSPDSSSILANFGSTAFLNGLLDEKFDPNHFRLPFADPNSIGTLMSIPSFDSFNALNLICSQIVSKQPSTKNIINLIEWINTLLNTISESPSGIITAENNAITCFAIFHVRLLFHSIISTQNPAQVINLLSSPDSSGITVDHTLPLLQSITTFLITFSPFVTNFTMPLYKEVLKLLLVLSSTQLCADPSQPESSKSHLFLEKLMAASLPNRSSGESPTIDPTALVEILLHHFISRTNYESKNSFFPTLPLQHTQSAHHVDIEAPAPSAPTQLSSGADTVLQSSTTWSTVVELGKFFTFPFAEFARMLATGDNTPPRPPTPLADISILILLVLSNFKPSSGVNPYKTVVLQLSNEGSESSAAVSNSHNNAKVNFNRLYEAIMDRIQDESTLVLLYLLLKSKLFFDFFTTKSDLDTLLVPLISALYVPHEHTRVRVYVILILCLILTSDVHLIQSIQPVSIATPSWFKEKYIKQIPLLEFMILVLCRTITLNLAGLRDTYLDINCLACLGNLAPHVTALSYYSSKKLMKIFESYKSKYFAVQAKITSSRSRPQSAGLAPVADANSSMEVSEETIINMSPSSTHEDVSTTPRDIRGVELEHFEDCLRIQMEIFDVLFRKKLSNNPQFIYTLACTLAPFDDLISNAPSLQPHASVLQLLTESFIRYVQESEVTTPNGVLEQITKFCLQFRPTNLPPVPELQFQYEETNAAPFFTSTIWRICVKYPELYWDPRTIVLYDTGLDPVYSGEDTPDDPPRN